MHILRKHKRGLLIGMMFFIGLPMLFFGLPSVLNDSADIPGMAVVASVGYIPVMESDFIRRLDEIAGQRSFGGERPSNRELLATGAVDEVLNYFVDAALIRLESEKRNFTVDEELLIEEFKKDLIFQDENGIFSKQEWNTWVRASEEQKINWNGMYQNMNRQIARNVYITQALAPAARVFDSDIDKELEARYTKLQVKYVKIEAEAEPTEEDIKLEFETNPERYKKPDRRQAAYVAISLEPEVTAEVNEAVAKANAAEDFGALADEISDMGIDNQGEMGWLTQPEDASHPENALFALAVGEVSGAVATIGGYYIYTNEEERMSTPAEEDGESVREIHGRRILINVSLSLKKRTARMDQARELLGAARGKTSGETQDETQDEAEDEIKDTKSLSDAATEKGLTVVTTDWFQTGDQAIEGLASSDVFMFIQRISTIKKGGFPEIIQAARNIYVAQVTDFEEGGNPDLEEVRDKVRDNAINTLKRGEAYLARVEELATEVKEKAESLEKARELFPELALEIKESQEFSVKQSSFVSELFVYANTMFQLLGDKEIGTVEGPLRSLIGDTFVVELTKKTPPAEEDKTAWSDERDEIRNGLLQVAENAYFYDFRLYLRNKEYPVLRNDAVIARVLGLDQALEEPVETEAANAETPEEGSAAKEDAAISIEPAADPAPEE